MSSLINLARDVMAAHGWTTQQLRDAAETYLDFDLVAENESAIAFFSCVSGSHLRRKADAYRRRSLQ